MILRPAVIVTPNPTTPIAKRTLFRIALNVAMIGSVVVGVILLLQGGLALGNLRYFIDVGQHPLHITSVVLLIFGLFSLLTFVILTIGLIKVSRKFAIIATGLLVFCSLALIAFSIWSFATLSGEQLPRSINNTLVKELDQTQFSVTTGNNLIVDNTQTMARLEKQHRCCGLVDPVDDYRTRQSSAFGSSSSSTGGNNKGRTSNSQKNPSASVLLPISCCNENYRSNDNTQCLDVYGNNSNPLSRYNTEGCLLVITREKFQRIQQQGFTTIVTACLAVISSIALGAVLKLLNENYQVAPLIIDKN